MVRTIILTIAVIIIIYTGILLSKSEYPFGTFLLTIHKLISLAVVLFIGVTVYKSPSLEGSNQLVIIISILLYIISFITGGVISAFESAPYWVVWGHRIMAWSATLSMILFIARAVKL